MLPGVADLGIAKMVQGIDVVLFRPDEELRKLARLAVELGVADALGDGAVADGDAPAALAAVAGAPGGARVDRRLGGRRRIRGSTSPRATACTRATASGAITSRSRWASSATTSARLQAGEEIERPTEQIRAERDRITAEYRELFPDDEARAVFDGKLGLARLVFPYVEDHNFYIEHWSLSIFWRKIRQLGQVLADAGFWREADDIFYVRRDELQQVIFDYGNGWGVGVEPMGPYYWPAEIARRKRIIAALELKAPAPAMNEPPAIVTEPFTIMLYGITSEAVSGWLNAGVDGGVTSAAWPRRPALWRASRASSAGPSELSEIQEGEVLVTRITAPSWGPVFGRIAAAVTDIGGMMSHAAIVCREYGLPAVTGTGSATTVDPDRPARPGRRQQRHGHRPRWPDHGAVWAAARPYMRARKNDVHIPMAYDYAQRLLAQHPEVDGEIVSLAILLHDIGWAVVDQDAIYRDGFGPDMMESEVRRAHEREGARLAREILAALGYDAADRRAVVEIIDGHDTRAHALSPEDELVKDADVLWRFSVAGHRDRL